MDAMARHASIFCGYGEFKRGTELHETIFPNAYRLRGLLGVTLPSKLGDIMLYFSADVERRYGIRALTQETTFGFGIRVRVSAPVHLE